MNESQLKFNYTTYIVLYLRILVRLYSADVRSGTYSFPIQIWNHLRDRFIFKFVLVRQILVGYTNVYFCERLNFNPFSCTFVHFNIVVLTWHDFTPYFIVFTMSISARVFHTFIMCFRCIIYVTTLIIHTFFWNNWIMALFYLPSCSFDNGIILLLFVTNIQ